MTLSSFWNRDEQRELLEGLPSSFEHWQVGDDIEPSRRKLLNRVEFALSSEIVSTEVRAHDRNLVLEVELEDGRREIVRAPIHQDPSTTWSPNMLESEVALLGWLSERTTLPVPRLRCVVRPSMSEPWTFAVMEKLPGDCLMNTFGDLSLSTKELIIRETAGIVLELHSMEVPQHIGTTLIHDNVVDITPFTTIPFNAATSRVYDTLEDYIYALIDARLATEFVGAGDADRSMAAVVLDRLREELIPVLHRLSGPLYRRCVLCHDDMHAGNVLIDAAGHISGLVDWEFHSTKPIVLAVDYPSWIVYDGMSDPRFAQEGTWWLVSPEEADKLRTSYAEIVRAKDEDYWRALVDGEVLRRIEDWMTVRFIDPGCTKLAAWMDTVFSTGTKH